MRISSFVAIVSMAGISLLFASPCLSQSLPRFGVGAKLSTLGFGLEGATAVTRQSNVRAGLNFRLGIDQDAFAGQLDLSPRFQYSSFEAHFDWFFGGFRVSPGVLVRDSLDSLPGSFDVSQNQAAPMLTVGWGNLLSRRGGRVSFNIEGGVVFRGKPEIDPVTNPCQTIAELCQNLGFLQNVSNEIVRFGSAVSSVSAFDRYNPVFSIGVGFRIK